MTCWFTEKEEMGKIPAPFAVLIYFCNCFYSTLCSSLGPWSPRLQTKPPPNPLTLHSLWERVENRTWKRNPVVKIKAGKMLTSSCCGQHRLDLEKFKLILLSCCVNTFPSSDIKLHHIIFCSLHLSLSGVLCPFLNTLSKKCHECDWRAHLFPVVAPCGWDGLCLAHGSSWSFPSEASPTASSINSWAPAPGTRIFPKGFSPSCWIMWMYNLPIWNWAGFSFGNTASYTYLTFFFSCSQKK